MRRIVFSILTLGFVLIFGVLAGAGILYLAPGPLTQDTTVIIPKGSGSASTAQSLRQAGVIANQAAFLVAVRLLGVQSALKAGEYAFPARISLKDAIGLLKEGKSIVHNITVPEGLTSFQIVEILDQMPILSGTIDTLPPEGSLLPETYQYTYGDTRQDVLNRMTAAMDRLLKDLWEKRNPDSILKTPAEAVTLASIVEKETGVSAERPRVAGVFVNRLNQGMPLQSDPTVIYAVTEGKSILDRGLRRSELASLSPYNTYVHPGLPPGPIAHPGKASLEAVFNPEKHGFLYFVADGTGGHVFAVTLAQHNKNVAAWRKIDKRSAGAKNSPPL